VNGSFVPSSLAETLRRYFLAEQSGVLVLSRTEVRKRVHFDRGMIFFADSSLEDERLLLSLVRTAALEASDAAELSGGPGGDDLAFARRLRDSGAVPAEKLDLAVRDLIQQILVSVFRWEAGEYRFHPGPPGGGDTFPTDVLLTFGYLMRGIRSMSGFAPIREAMLRLERPLRHNPDLYLPLERLALHPVQGFVLSRIDGSSRIREIASLIPPSEEDTGLRFLFGLMVLDVVQIVPPLEDGPLSVQRLLAGDREGKERSERETTVIREMYRLVTRGSPSEILGLDPTSPVEAIRQAYETRRDAFQASRFLKKVQEAYRDELVLVESKLLESYLALADDQVRSAREGAAGHEAFKLDMDTLSKRKELAKTAVQENLEEQVRRAEQFYQKAREYFVTKDFYNAIQYCEQALKANDADARYHFLLGQVLVRNPDYRWQKRAEQSLLRAAEIDPWNAEHFVELGHFYRTHNLLRKAKKHYLKAAEVMPSHTGARKALEELGSVEA
jgi:tetratricopeptide (TPR) repeat protein